METYCYLGQKKYFLDQVLAPSFLLGMQSHAKLDKSPSLSKASAQPGRESSLGAGALVTEASAEGLRRHLTQGAGPWAAQGKTHDPGRGRPARNSLLARTLRGFAHEEKQPGVHDLVTPMQREPSTPRLQSGCCAASISPRNWSND